jgi:hypothetical protein
MPELIDHAGMRRAWSGADIVIPSEDPQVSSLNSAQPPPRIELDK